MNEHGKEEPVFEIRVVIPRRVVQEEDKSSDCAYVLIEEFKKVGFVVERVIGIADEFIKLAAPLETLGRAAAELQIKERTHIGMDLQFEVEEVEAFVKQPDGSVFSWWKFFLYLLFMFLMFTYFTFYGMMVVGLTPSQQLAAVISSAFYSLWNLLSGFLIPKTHIPGCWIWFYYICPVQWTLRGIDTSQLGDVESKIVGPGFEGTVKEYLSASHGYEQKINGISSVGLSVIVLFAFILQFFGSFAVSIKVLNF